ncbi:T9SS type A sorting domain-containing protein [Ilyomonas limi]|uniref:T9SS type A sorting domain-containing protein n=1 Tax=Ilyomonas limi TaxID=2575867 RepID=A0A4U3L5C0_9BACT|nr:right-handed parallel beta-helix repeat-containing protein [Ilyomonas limi]TKK70345.1 T9SS type A sorting domain-containing protein [Ilyomonas limi]
MSNAGLILYFRTIPWKLLFLFFGLFFIGEARATNYYFSSSKGNDSRTAIQAQNPATPWQSLKKLNSFFNNLKPGDSVLLKRGDTFYGSITVSTSGAASLPIVISAYGRGGKPVISGFTTLSSWTDLGNGIYKSNCPECGVTDNMLTINDKPQMIGRYPNRSYLTFESHVSNTSITDNELKNSPNWAGAEVVIRKDRWIIDRNKIKNHSGNTISYTSASAYSAIDGYGYFIQNDPKTLDTLGEWYFEPKNKNVLVYFGSYNPALYIVKTSSIDTLVYLRYCNYITFDGLSFQGANVSAFELIAAGHIALQNCSIDFSGKNAIYGAWSQSSPFFSLTHSIINHTNNNAITLSGDFPNALIKYNTIKNTGLIAGMGENGGNSYEGIDIEGANSIIENNEIDSSGYNALKFTGDSIKIKNNLIKGFTLTKDDGGGIYTWNGSKNATPHHGMQIEGNIILNGIGAGEGTNNQNYLPSEGIYLDDNSSNLKVFANTIANCSHSGIYLHNSHEIQVLNNTTFNNGTQVNISHDNILPTSPTRNVALQHNVFFSSDASSNLLKLSTIANDINLFGIADSNYYARPLDDNYTISTSQSSLLPVEMHNLSKWQSSYQKDIHSKKSPKAIVPYFLKKLIGLNMVNNGSFTNNINGSSSWNSSGSCIASWDGSGKINGGALKVSYTKQTNGSTGVVVPVGKISSGKDYILKYSVTGIKPKGEISAFLRQSNSPYANLSAIKYDSITTKRSDYTVLFSSSATENNASIIFQVNDSYGTFWLDNIELNEASVTITNPKDSIRFEYNATTKDKSIILSETYLGIDSTTYSGKLILKPYSSIILLKNTPLKTSPIQSLNFEGKKKGTTVSLQWETSNAFNTSSFDILKSSDGVQFKKIGQVAANSIALTSSIYTFNDNTFSDGKSYYQIRVVSKDEKNTYSKTIVLPSSENVKLSVTPNPASNKIWVYSNFFQDYRNAVLTLHDIKGSVIKVIPITSSYKSIPIDISNLAKGTYIITLVDGNTICNQKFIKQ